MNFTQEEIDNGILGSAEKLNKRLTDLHNMTVENVLRSIPAMVSSLVRYSVGMSEITQDFYKANPHLAEHKDIVASVIEKIDRENPGKNITDILVLAKPEIEERVAIANQTVATNRPVVEPTRENINKSINGIL